MVQAAPSDIGSEARLALLPARAGDACLRLARELGLTRTFADWLTRRGFADAEATRRFLNPRLSELSNPSAMADRAAAADRIAAALRKKERIAVFGDYDCDGMTSAAILTEVLRELGGEVSPLVASRFDGGYGLSAGAVLRVVSTRATLLVTCDCGSSDHERIADLARRGVETIVIDHHLVPDQPLPALAFLNPHRTECGFGYKGLASCGLVLSIGAAVRTSLGRALDLRRWLDLVALGTIADVAPLDGDNRALVRAGLRALAEGRRPGIRALLSLANLEGLDCLSSEDVSFRLAPRLNAPGRLGAPDAALELLLAPNLPAAHALAAQIEQASIERRAVQDRISSEALEEIRRERYDERPAIVLGREGWNHGVVGIVAGRLAAAFGRPVVMVGFDGGRGRGSVRGPEGARLHDALSACEGTLARFGGHQAAAGVELELARLSEFREAFESAVRALSAVAPVSGSRDSAQSVWLSSDDDPARVVADFAQLEPCGTTNPAPEILVEALVVSAREVTGGHLKLELEIAGRRLSAFGPELGRHVTSAGGRVLLAGRLRPDRYRGGGAVELRIERVL